MAIVHVKRCVEGRTATKDWQGRITFTDMYEVVTDTIATEQDVAGNGVTDPDSGLTVPVHGDEFADNANAVCTDTTPAMSSESYYIWYITCTYKTHPDVDAAGTSDNSGGIDTGAAGTTTGNPGEFPENPLLQPAKWKLGTIETTEPVEQWLRVKPNGVIDLTAPAAWATSTLIKPGEYRSANGNVYFAMVGGTTAGAGTGPAGQNPGADNTVTWAYWSTLAQATTDEAYGIMSAVMNSGKLPFDPPVMETVSIPTIIVTKNIPSITLPFFMALKGAQNKTLWRTVIPPRCAKVLRAGASNEYVNKGVYVQLEVEIGLNPDTWDHRILDCGYGSHGMRTVPDPANPALTIQKKVFTRFKDPNGDDVGQAVPMDGNGGRLNPDDPPVFLRGVARQTKLLDFNTVFSFW